MYIASDGVHTAVIERDPEPFNPRDPEYQDNAGKMICWHRRYSLGDKHDFESPNDFLLHLSEKVKDKDIFAFIKDGNCSAIRAVPIGDSEDSYNIQVNDEWADNREEWTEIGCQYADGQLCFESSGYRDRRDLMEYCTNGELLQLIDQSNEFAVLSLYLYDHSGITLSTDSFIGRAQHAEWDSGQVGFIYMDKDTAIRELANAGDEVYVAKAINSDEKVSLPLLEQHKDLNRNDILLAHGFSPVSPEHVHHSRYEENENKSESELVLHLAAQEKLYKKGSRLYAFDGQNSDATKLTLRPVATFNPDIVPLTDDTWRARAEECLRVEVVEYDNYLTGNIFGIRTFEGFEEMDSCWGYNPGTEKVETLFQEMQDEWLPKTDLPLQYDDYDSFEIEDYLEDNEFPAFRDQLQEAVLAVVEEEENSLYPFPFAMAPGTIRENHDGVLDDIVEELYQNHIMPDRKEIFSAIFEQAGISRVVQPKLTARDLQPDRDYTADELMSMIQKKKSTLDQIIAGAAAKSDAKESGTNTRTIDPCK